MFSAISRGRNCLPREGVLGHPFLALLLLFVVLSCFSVSLYLSCLSHVFLMSSICLSLDSLPHPFFSESFSAACLSALSLILSELSSSTRTSLCFHSHFLLPMAWLIHDFAPPSQDICLDRAAYAGRSPDTCN